MLRSRNPEVMLDGAQWHELLLLLQPSLLDEPGRASLTPNISAERPHFAYPPVALLSSRVARTLGHGRLPRGIYAIDVSIDHVCRGTLPGFMADFIDIGFN